MPAAVAKLLTACSASCGSNAGVPSGRLSGIVDLPHDERTPGQVEGDLDQRLVEREHAAGEAAHADLVAERLAERLAERDGDVFDGVVGVDVQIADGLDRQVEPAVAAELIEHVVVERDARGDRRSGPMPSRSIEIVDRRLLRRPRASAVRLTPGHREAPRSRAVEEHVVLVGRADRDAQAILEPRPATAVADEDAVRRAGRCHTSPPDRRAGGRG